MDASSRPEPMNAATHHSKVKISTILADHVFVAGGNIAGKLEMECRADKGLGISVMAVELFAFQELISRDHSATSNFIHSRRLFQGPGLPPSNAVQAHPMPGDPPLPPEYHQAKRGASTFIFRIPVPATSPSSVVFGPNLAKVRYELRTSVQVSWKGQKTLVMERKEVDVVEAYEELVDGEPEGIVVGENGKIWAQGRIVGGILVAGESGCVELEVKNHSIKRNTGLSVMLSRKLILPKEPKNPLQLTDTLTTVSFKGPEYIIPPGAEGVASLVFEVPSHAKGVRGGFYHASDPERRQSEAIFQIQCYVEVKLSMGFGNKDIGLELPVTIVHPSALPDIPPEQPLYPMHYGLDPEPNPYAAYSALSPDPYIEQTGMSSVYPFQLEQNPYTPYPAISISPVPAPYVDQNMVWLPPPTQLPNPYQYFSPPIHEPYYFPPPESLYDQLQNIPPRPSSADQFPLEPATGEEGKGQRASRVTQHLRLSSRNRSVSPMSHRYPIPPPLPSTPTLNASSPLLHSPRPVLTPKQSFTEHVDLLTSRSVPKSERVETLERLANEVAARNLSDDLLNGMKIVDINKTLPGTPSALSTSRPSTDLRSFVHEAPVDKTPPTPLLKPAAGRESGLDALERMLAAEVGTQKLEEKRRAALPIAIPPQKSNEAINDSAISSLTLGGEELMGAEEIMGGAEDESDGKTQKGSRKSGWTEKDGEKKSHRKKEKEREKKGDLRKAAKGRVAAWLGGISAEMDEIPFIPVKDPEPMKEVAVLDNENDTYSNPNPRSSGFVPIGTLKRDKYTRTLVPVDTPATDPPVKPVVHYDVSPEKNPWESALTKKMQFPPVDSEAKYDIRSARGGRGGKVTAVAAIWSKAAVRPPSSVPAILSSSTAKPTLSTTASLAAPMRISAMPISDSSKETVKASAGVRSDMMFGKARLRDLIRKYQG